ncbi:hypothetical protein F4776DRAFT_636396 [Hypoxylon sp. NC0597]|nr:hypothetical protein F4776DRAFT_636396 [Hypoxylon sp. NC0597]
MSDRGTRGPSSDFMIIGLRLLIDQTLENGTGVGACPWRVSCLFSLLPHHNDNFGKGGYTGHDVYTILDANRLYGACLVNEQLLMLCARLCLL